MLDEKNIKLVELSLTDDKEIYDMLQRIGKCENDFSNHVNGESYVFYKNWLQQQYDWSIGKSLPEGFSPQTTYWLKDNNIVVGMGKIRHQLNDYSRKYCGNIGYAIDPLQRGKGYANILLKLLLQKAKELKVNEIILTIEKGNIASQKVIEKNGGVLDSENEKMLVFKIERRI